MSSIMIFIFIIYIFNTTNNGEKCTSREQLLFEKKLNACATKSLSMNI